MDEETGEVTSSSYGYYVYDSDVGADTFYPFSNGSSINGIEDLTEVGSITGNGSIDCTAIDGYTDLTEDNFLVVITKGAACQSSSSYAFYGTTYAPGFTVAKTYTADTGTLALTGLQQTVSQKTSSGGTTCGATQKMEATVYLVA